MSETIHPEAAANPLLRLAARRRAGFPIGLTSVCSAHMLVLEAALRHAAAAGQPVLIEATCNQVNQDGGYTGLTPADFNRKVAALADTCGLPPALLLLGGDHLGPNPWTALSADAAMAKAAAMVEAYVAAGFSKLHLDTSMPCSDDPVALPEGEIAARAARLAKVAEDASQRLSTPPPLYVIGTEVPPPGGARERIDTLLPTEPASARRTIAAHAEAFAALGIAAAMERVIAIVIQPGVEFGSENVVAYNPAAASALVDVLNDTPTLVFEAHSTDYQTRAALASLVRDGFGILKVGPGLTFALREALYRLDAMAAVLVPAPGTPALADVMEEVMLTSPQHWAGHYHGTTGRMRLLRHYSYSDRIRYYWPHPQAVAAIDRLVTRLEGVDVPETLISHFFPTLLAACREGRLSPTPHALLIGSVTAVLEDYAQAGAIFAR